MHENVAVGVVDGESNEGLLRPLPGLEPRCRLLQRQHLIAAGAYVGDHGLEIIRRDLEAAVGGEAWLESTARSDMVEGEDGADTPEQRRKDARCARVEHGVKAATKQICVHHRSGLMPPDVDFIPSCTIRDRLQERMRHNRQEFRHGDGDYEVFPPHWLMPMSRTNSKQGRQLVGAAGFEPATPTPPE